MGPATIVSTTAHGWSAAVQQSGLDGALKDYAPWAHTAIDYPMNPLSGSMTVTDEVMQRCAASSASGGPWCILANHALSPVSARTGRTAPVYAQMDPIWSAAGGRPGFTSVPTATLVAWDNAVRQGTTPTC